MRDDKVRNAESVTRMPSRYLESTVLYIFGVKEKKEKNILSYLREREEESLIVIHSRSSRYTNIKRC